MRVSRAAYVDEYSEDGQTVVLLEDGSVLALSPLTSFVLAELSAAPIESAQLASVLVEVFGPPPGDPRGIGATNEVLLGLVGFQLVALEDG